MIIHRVLKGLKENKRARQEGKDILIPFKSLPRLSTVLPGIQKGRYVIVTANSKVGKTQIADFMFMYEPIKYVLDNPSSNIKVKIFYFSLEMSKEDKILQMISNKIYTDKKAIMSPDTLQSYFENYILEDKVQKYIEDNQGYFEKVEQIVTFIDNIRNPFGIYAKMREYARANGKFYLNNGEQVHIDQEHQMYDYYVPDNPEEHVICIIDNFNLLQPEKGEELWDAMFRFSSKFCLLMRDNFKYTVVGIQQQAGDQEKQQFTFKGESMMNKVRPSADGLGDCKLTGRDCDLMLGLFAPARYKQKEYQGFDIEKLKDNYRELSIIFNRRGGGNKSVDLYFQGEANYFRELDENEYRV